MQRYKNAFIIGFFYICVIPTEVLNGVGDENKAIQWIEEILTDRNVNRFDIRNRRPECDKNGDSMRYAYDEKTSWAVIASSVLTDRMCIKDYDFDEIFAFKELLSCVKDYGGDLNDNPKSSLGRAWEYYRDFGALTIGHYAYYSTCPAEDPIKSGPQLRYKISKMLDLKLVNDVKEEIMYKGPVSALLTVEDVQRDINWPGEDRKKMTSEEKEKMMHEDIGKMLIDGKENRRHIVKILGWNTSVDGIVYWLCSKPYRDNANIFKEFYVRNKDNRVFNGKVIVSNVIVKGTLKTNGDETPMTDLLF